MFLERHYFVSTGIAPPTADGALLALQSGGFDTTLVQVRQDTIELATVPNGTRVLIDISNDLQDPCYSEDSTMELLEDWAAEGKISPKELPAIRRLIILRHLDHADKNAIQRLMDYLCTVSVGKEIHAYAKKGSE